MQPPSYLRSIALIPTALALALAVSPARAVPWPFELATRDGASLHLGRHASCELALSPSAWTWSAPAATATVTFVGAAPALVHGEEPVPIHRYLGADPSAWTHTLGYQRVVHTDLWPGIDLVVDATATGLVRDFHVAAGADPTSIRLRVEGAPVHVDGDGRLVIAHPACPIVESAPIGWQDSPTGRDMVPVAWVVTPDGEVALELGPWDPTRALVIDPIIPSGGLFGPTLHEDSGYDVAIAPTGETYVVGGAHPDPNVRGTLTRDAFALALDEDLKLLWLTWYGGTKDNLLPPTCSEHTVPGDLNSPCKTWVAHASGLGGNDDAIALAIIGDRLAVVGHTFSTDLPTLDPFIAAAPLAPAPTHKGRRDGFVLVLDRESGAPVMASYLGGDDDDLVSAVQAVAPDTFAVLGGTRSPDWGTPQYQPPPTANRVAHHAYAFTIKKTATDPIDRWQPAPHFAPSPLVVNQPFGRSLFNAIHIVAGEPWFLGEHEDRPMRWRLPNKERKTPVTDYLATTGGAAIVQAFTLPSDTPGVTRSLIVGNTLGDVGGFDGFACDATELSSCNGAPCGMTDAFVAFLEGDHCVNVLFVGGSLGDVLFGAAFARYAPGREYLVLAGRTASADLQTRAAIQPEAGQVVGNGVDAFYAVVDTDLQTLRILSYLGGEPDLESPLVSSDDVATAVALGPDREATLTGMTRTRWATFLRKMGPHTPAHNPEAGQAFVVRMPVEVADLSVALDIAKPVLAHDATTDVTVRVENTGTVDATGVSVDITLDADGVTMHTAPPASVCTQNASPLSWTCRPSTGIFESGARSEFTFVLKAPAKDGVYFFRVEAKTATFDPNPDNNDIEGLIIVGGIDFSPSMLPVAPTPDPAVVGMHESALAFLIMRNRGGELARGRVTLTSATPLVVAVDDISGCTATACGDGKTCLPLSCDGPEQSNNAGSFSRTISFGLLDPSAVIAPETGVVITAATTPLDGKPDLFPANDKTTLPITFRRPDLVAVSGTPSVRVVPWSGATTITLVGRDDGPGHTDTFFIDLDARPFTLGSLPTGCQALPTPGMVRCALPRPADALPTGQLYSVQIPLVAPPKADGEVAREVSLPARFQGLHPDSKPGNETLPVKVWLGAVDLRVEAPTPAPTYRTYVDEEVSWTIKNEANDDASNVVVTMLLAHPAGVAVFGASARGGAIICPVTKTGEGSVVTCTLGAMAAQESTIISMSVDARGKGDVVHTINVSSTEPNASAALYPMKHTFVAKGPDIVPSVRLPGVVSFPDGFVRGTETTLVFSATNAGLGASPPEGSKVVIDLTIGATGLTSSNASLDCTWAQLLLPDRRGTRITCKLPFLGAENEHHETTFTITPDQRGNNQVLATATDSNEEKPGDNVATDLFGVLGAELEPTLSGPAKVEAQVAFSLDLKIKNLGPAAAKPAHGLLTFPADRLEVVGSVPTGCTSEPGRIECEQDVVAFGEVTFTLPLRGKKLGSALINGSVNQPKDNNEKVFDLKANLEVVGPDLEVTHVKNDPTSFPVPPQTGSVDFRLRNNSTTTEAIGTDIISRPKATGTPGCDAPLTEITSSMSACSTGIGPGLFYCDLAPGAEAILRFTYKASCIGKVDFEVEAHALGPELDKTNNKATTAINVRAPKLGLVFTPSTVQGPYDDALAGALDATDLSGYGIAAGDAPEDKIHVDLVDVPSPFQLESLTTTSGTCTLSPARCLLESIPANGSIRMQYTVRSSHGPATRTLRALGTVRTAAGLPTAATATLEAQGPDLSISVLTAPSGKTVDERGEWVMEVHNTGPAPAEHPAIAFTEPAGLIDLITVDGATGCAATNTGRVCTLAGPIAPGAHVDVTFGARLKKAGDVTIPARVTSRYEPDANANNNAASLTTRVLGPDLAVTLAAIPDTAGVGDAVTLQLSVQNVGSVASDATTATINLGALVSVSALAAGCTLQQGVAHCAIPSLSPTQTEVFSSQIAGTRAGAITLSAQAKVSGDADPSNDTSTATLTITSSDSDGDGTPDAAEDQGPNNGDANRDNTKDSLQPHVTTIVIPKYGPFIAESLTANTILELVPRANPSPLPAGHRAPLAPDGTFGFRVSGLAPGALATVRFTFPAGVPAHAWWKYDDGTQQWSEFTWDAGTQTGAKLISARVLEVTVQDDGRGDDDPADGTIEDPGTPLLPVMIADDAGDADDADPGDGQCATAANTCTLRAALTEINASQLPRYVVFDFAAPTTIAPTSALPTLTTPAVIDGSDVPGPTASEPGLTISGASLPGPGRLLEFGVAAAGLVGVKLRDVDGHGLVITQPAARVADSWLGRPLYATGGTTEHAAVVADGATDLMIAESWVGRINGGATYGLDLSGEDIRVDGARVNVDPEDGLRLSADLTIGLRLRDTPRARIDRVVVNGANTGVLATGDGTGAVLRESLFGLGANGLCNAFTRDDPGPAEEGRGPCLEKNLQGLVLDGASGWTIGGLDQADRNVFGDHQDAIVVEGGGHDNHFYNNLVGLAADGTCQPAPDIGVATLYDGLCRLYNVRGLAIEHGHDNVVGAPGAGNVFGVGTLELTGADTTDNLVKSNFIGLFADLQTPVKPGFTAQVQTAFYVGGGATGTTIDDNTLSGLYVEGAGTNDTVITNNRIGLLPSGLALPGPDVDFDTYWRVWPRGVLVRDGAARVTVSHNTIANTFDVDACVHVDGHFGAVSEVAIADNLLGLTADGRAATVCEGGAVRVYGVDDVVIDDNLVGACGAETDHGLQLACVRLLGGARGTLVRDNVFGLLRDGRDGPWGAVTPIANPLVLLADAPATTLSGNVMLGSPRFAIYDVSGSGVPLADGTLIVGNRIGVDPDGTRRGAPTEHGILAVGAHAKIGGVAPGEGNTIAGAGAAGIRVGAVSGVVIRGNALADNAELGVSLGGAIPIANDALDADGGPNGSQNHPIVGAFDEDTTSVAVTLSSAASTTYMIDVYGVADPDPSGHGEADLLLGSAELTTDGSGQAAGSVTLSRSPNPGESLTAIATGPDGSSEFGPSVVPIAGPEADLALTLYVEGAAIDQWGYFQPTVENTGPDTATGLTVEIDLPAGVELGAEDWITGGTCTPRTGGLSCAPPDLGLGEIWEVAYLVRSDSAGTYPIVATVASETRDPDPSDDRAEADLLVGPVRYLIQQTSYVDYRTYATGEAVALTSTVACYPGFVGTITDLTITLDVPTGTSVIPDTHPCTVAGAEVTCELGALACAAGFPVNTVTLDLALVFSQGGTHDVVVEASSPAPNIEGPQVATLPPLTVTAPPPALSIDLTSPGSALPSGALATWTATLSNSGASPLVDVQLIVTPPAGMVFRGADAACAPLGDVVICLPGEVPASGSLPIALAFDAPPADGTLQTCARRVSGEAVLEEHCDELGVTVAPFNRALATTTPVVEAATNAPATLSFTVSSASGAPAGTLVLTPSIPVDSVYAPACAAVGDAWHCPVDALAPGAETRIALELVHADAAVITWLASLEGADADALDDATSAVVLVAPSDLCSPWIDTAGFVDGDATPVDAEGFAPGTPSPEAPLRWVLTDAAGALTTPSVALPATTDAVWISWFDARTFGEGADATVAISTDGGQSWQDVYIAEPSPTPGQPAAYSLALGRAALGVDTVNLQARWRVAGVEPGAWQLGGLALTTCQPAQAVLPVEVHASPSFVAVDLDTLASTTFTVENDGSEPLLDAMLTLASDHPEVLVDAGVDSGVCTFDALGARCALPPLDAGESVDVVLSGQSATDLRVALAATLSAPLTLSGTTSAAASWRFGAPSGEGATLSWQPAQISAAPAASGSATLEVAGQGGDVFPGGAVTLTPAPGLMVTPTSGDCLASGDTITCEVPLLGPGQTHALPIEVSPVGASRTELVNAAWAAPGATASADLSVEVAMGGALSLGFVTPDPVPAAREPTLIDLEISAAGAVTAGARVTLDASPALTLRSVTGPDADCAVLEGQASCELPAIGDGQTLTLAIEVLAEDAGAHALFAALALGPAGADPTAAFVWTATRDCAAHPCAEDPCLDTVCDPSLGCLVTTREGEACDPELSCERDGVCSEGACLATGEPCPGADVCEAWQLDCDDQDACTEDTCEPFIGCVNEPAGECCDASDCPAPDALCQTATCVDGACGTAPVADGTPCDADGDACTEDDACVAGTCVAGPAPDCDDGDACTADSCSPATGCVNAPIAGCCQSPADCPATGNACTAATCTAGVCGTAPVSNGTPCDADGSLCTNQDSCQNGTCTAGAPLQCAPDTTCTTTTCQPSQGCVVSPIPGCCTSDAQCPGVAPKCQAIFCDLPSGQCLTTPLPNGTACDADGSVCTEGDSCLAGVCTAGPPRTCNDERVCTTDSCDARLGCRFTLKSGCCESDAACPNDANPCTTRRCDTATGQCGQAPVADGTACDADDSVCTEGDACLAGTCSAGLALACDDGDPCTSDSCDPSSGCRHVDIVNCCQAASECPDDPDPCLVAACDLETRRCTTAPASDGSPCDADESVCTDADACLQGACAPGDALDCDDGDLCTIDACDPATGCTHTASTDPACVCAPLHATTACVDGDLAWHDGCAEPGATAVACDDGDIATEDRCDPELGVCLRVPLGRDDCDTACAGDWTSACEGGHLVWRDPCGLGAGIAAACASAEPCAVARCDDGLGACVLGVSDAPSCAPEGGCDATRALGCDGSDLVWRDGCGERLAVALSCDDGDPRTDDRCDPELAACVRTPSPTELPSRLCESGPGDDEVEAVEVVEAAEVVDELIADTSEPTEEGEPIDTSEPNDTSEPTDTRVTTDTQDAGDVVAPADPGPEDGAEAERQGSTRSGSDGCGCASGGSADLGTLGSMLLVLLLLVAHARRVRRLSGRQSGWPR